MVLPVIRHALTFARTVKSTMNQAARRYLLSETGSRFLGWTVFCAFIYPFLTASAFTTLDGPGHIHNAKVIHALITQSDSLYERFFELNTFISPNLLGHYILLVVVLVVGEDYVDRTMLVLCMLTQFAALQYFVRSLKLSFALALLPICFLINTPLFSGFYSFSLGVAAMFWTAGYAARHIDKLWEGVPVRFQMVILASMLVLVYLLHLVPAVIACAMVAIAYLLSVFNRIPKHQWRWRLLWRSMKPLFFAALPVVLLIAIYQLHDAETSNYVFIEKSELWRQWCVMQGFIINHRHEFAFTRWYWMVPAVALIADIVLSMFKGLRIYRASFPKQSMLMLAGYMLTLAALYFVMPDASSGGGALTVRLNYLLVTVMSIFIFSCIRTSLLQWLAVSALVIVSFDHANKILSYHNEQSYFMRDIREMKSAIQEPGVLLVHRFRYDWPLEHVTKYLGNHHDVVMVDALGAHKIYAPMMWKPDFRNRDELVAMFDKGWQRNPREILDIFPTEHLYVLTIGRAPDEDSVAYAAWLNELRSRGAQETWSTDSLMHLYSIK